MLYIHYIETWACHIRCHFTRCVCTSKTLVKSVQLVVSKGCSKDSLKTLWKYELLSLHWKWPTIFEIFRANACILMLYSTLHFSWCSSIWMSVSLDLRSSLAACRAEMSASGFSPFVRPFLAIESNTREALLMLSLRLHRNFPRRSQGFQFLLFLILLSDRRAWGWRRDKERQSETYRIQRWYNLSPLHL